MQRAFRESSRQMSWVKLYVVVVLVMRHNSIMYTFSSDSWTTLLSTWSVFVRQSCQIWSPTWPSLTTDPGPHSSLIRTCPWWPWPRLKATDVYEHTWCNYKLGTVGLTSGKPELANISAWCGTIPGTEWIEFILFSAMMMVFITLGTAKTRNMTRQSGRDSSYQNQRKSKHTIGRWTSANIVINPCLWEIDWCRFRRLLLFHHCYFAPPVAAPRGSKSRLAWTGNRWETKWNV